MAGKNNPWAQDEELQQVLMGEWYIPYYLFSPFYKKT